LVFPAEKRRKEAIIIGLFKGKSIDLPYKYWMLHYQALTSSVIKAWQVLSF